MKDEFVQMIHFVTEWEQLLHTYKSQGRLAELTDQLSGHLDDPVARIRMITSVQREHLDLEEQISQLSQIEHPLAKGFMVYLGCELLEGVDHQQAIETYLGTPDNPRQPHEVLFGGRDLNSDHPEEMEAYMLLQYGLAKTLSRFNQMDLAEICMQSAHNYADFLQYDYLQLATRFTLAQMAAELGQEGHAHESMSHVLELSGGQHEDLAAEVAHNLMWLDRVEGQEIRVPHVASLEMSIIQLLEQFKKVLENKNFQVPRKKTFLDRAAAYPLFKTMVYLDRGRALGFAIRDLELKTIRSCSQEVLDLAEPHFEDSMNFYCCIWIRAFAMMHNGQMEKALEVIQDQLVKRPSQRGRAVGTSLLLELQFLLGDTDFIPELPQLLKGCKEYFRGTNNTWMATMIDMAGRGLPNAMCMFHHLDMSTGEFEKFVHRTCVVVGSKEATYRGKVVGGYPLGLAKDYPMMFRNLELHHQPRDGQNGQMSLADRERERIRVACWRHRKALKDLKLREMPGTVYEQAVLTVVEHIKMRSKTRGASK